MLDGLGLVYRGQEGTGAAALVNPKQGNIQEIASLVSAQNKAIQAAKQKQGDDIYKDINSIELGDWDVRTQSELVQGRDEYINKVTEAYKSGYNPKDITTPIGQDLIRERNALKTKIERHKEQKQAYIDAIQTFQKENAKAVLEGREPIYNTEQTLKNIEAWNNAESIDARSQLDPNSLLVFNEAPFDPYEIFETVKGVPTEYSNEDPTQKTSGSSNSIPLSRTQDFVKTDKGQKYFKKGVEKGYWIDAKSMNAWANRNNPDAKKDYNKTVKEPKSSPGTLTKEDRAKIGEPGVDMNVKVPDKVLKGKEGAVGTLKDAQIDYFYQTPNLNINVPNVELQNWKSGVKVKGGNGVSIIKDGTLGVTMIDKDGRIIPINKKTTSYTYQDNSGKNVTLKANSPSELKKKILTSGAGKYEVLLMGKTADKTPVDAYAIAPNVITESGESNLGKAYKSMVILQEKAVELNASNISIDKGSKDPYLDVLNIEIK
jgi:hypothetical protein